jgi:FPC/CPF motif-containing protein YcgG
MISVDQDFWCHAYPPQFDRAWLPPPDDRDHPRAMAFRDFVKDLSFPCVGAKSALAKGDLTIIVAKNIACPQDDERIHTALLGYIARYKSRPDLFQSFAVIFDQEQRLDELSFETALWARLQAIADRDATLGHPWDHRVAQSPQSPHFSFSLAREGFFVVGLHPGANRPARRFEAPVMVFNLHDQFEKLRAEGRYDKLRAAITARDKALAGSVNPMLARHGEISEARQYSGRIVDEAWTCPFRTPQAIVTKNGLAFGCAKDHPVSADDETSSR